MTAPTTLSRASAVQIAQMMRTLPQLQRSRGGVEDSAGAFMTATLDVAGTDHKMRWDEVAVGWDEGWGRGIERLRD
jgi:hypothetical protein